MSQCSALLPSSTRKKSYSSTKCIPDVGPGLNAYLWRLVHVSDFLWYLAPILARLVHFADNRQFAQPDSLATRVATNLDGRET